MSSLCSVPAFRKPRKRVRASQKKRGESVTVRARRKGKRVLALYMNGERVGTWRLTTGAEELEYAESWLQSPRGRPISLRFPLAPGKARYSGSEVHSYFENLLPDTKAIRERLAQRFRADSTDAFSLLAVIGRDCVGALQILPEEEEPSPIETIVSKPLSDKDIAAILRNLTAPAGGIMRQDTQTDFRLSIPGAQEKTALLRQKGRWRLPSGTTPTTHIFKLPMGLIGNGQIDMKTSVENEWLCSKLMQAYGLNTAHCDIAQFGDQKALIVERFDRVLASDKSWIVRLPQEDLCQATGTSYLKKYQSDGGPGIDRILGLLRTSNHAKQDREDFLKCQIVFWLLAAIDGHAKNFSIRIEAKGNYHLTPFYDVLSAYPVMGNKAGQLSPQKAKLAMGVRGEQNMHYKLAEIQRRHWIETAQRNGIGDEGEAIVNELLARTPGVIATVRTQLPADFPEAVSGPILAGLAKAAKKLAT